MEPGAMVADDPELHPAVGGVRECEEVGGCLGGRTGDEHPRPGGGGGAGVGLVGSPTVPSDPMLFSRQCVICDPFDPGPMLSSRADDVTGDEHLRSVAAEDERPCEVGRAGYVVS